MNVLFVSAACFVIGMVITAAVMATAGVGDRMRRSQVDDYASPVDTVRDAIESLRTPAPATERIIVDTKAVRAVTQCPKCAEIGVHWLRESTGQPPNWVTVDHGLRICSVGDPSVDVGHSGDVQEMRRFGGDTFRTIGRTYVTKHGITMPARKSGLDERDLDVIRECRSCGHEWGQR